MRKALSPVITTVLLVVISVALALSAATFITDTQGEVSDRLTEAVQEQVQLRNVSCNGRTARFWIENSGNEPAEFGRADFRVYQGPTPNESFTREGISVDGEFENANSEGLFPVEDLDATFQSGERYTLELFFPASDYDMRGECIAGQRWWNLNWDYRRQIRVSDGGTGFVDDFDTASLIADGKMRDSCEDVRVVEDLEVQEYDVEGCGSSSTTVRFTTTLDEGPTDYDTYIYYGNNLVDDQTTSLSGGTEQQLMQEENRSDY